MGVVKAMIGFGRGKDQAESGAQMSRERFIREATLDEGLRHVQSTIDNLTELEARLAELEADLLGEGASKPEPLPEAEALGFDGFVPRLMEASLLIGAMTRRMHLRMGVLEGALGRRAQPVGEIEADVQSPMAFHDQIEEFFDAKREEEQAAKEGVNDRVEDDEDVQNELFDDDDDFVAEDDQEETEFAKSA